MSYSQCSHFTLGAGNLGLSPLSTNIGKQYKPHRGVGAPILGGRGAKFILTKLNHAISPINGNSSIAGGRRTQCWFGADDFVGHVVE